MSTALILEMLLAVELGREQRDLNTETNASNTKEAYIQAIINIQFIISPMDQL